MFKNPKNHILNNLVIEKEKESERLTKIQRT